MLSLGNWQLNRAEEKRQIEKLQLEREALPPLGITGQKINTEELEYRKLSVSGKFMANTRILIDNKVHNGQAGFHVVTPLQINGTNKYVLVNRGWVPLQNGSRAQPPEYETSTEALTLNGIAKLKTKDLVTINDANRTDQWPDVILVRWLDIEALAKETGLELLPFELLLDKENPNGFERDWKFVNSSPAKHISYAVQWFSFSLVLLIIYIVVNTKRIRPANNENSEASHE
jgi:surfeit locus 1 family protein